MSSSRMRTAKGVSAIIKDTDPDTSITVSFIRKIINSGNVPVVHVGNRKLVDADLVIEYINRGAPGMEPMGAEPGKIRPVQL